MSSLQKLQMRYGQIQEIQHKKFIVWFYIIFPNNMFAVFEYVLGATVAVSGSL